MKRLPARYHFLLVLLLGVGISTGAVLGEYHQAKLNRDLVAAIKRDDEAAALTALNAGASPNARDYSNEPEMSVQARFSNWLIILRHPEVNDVRHPTAICLLFSPLAHTDLPFREHPTLLQALLARGADPNTFYGRHGETPLMIAACYDFKDSVRLLLDYGAEANVVSGWHRVTPLGLTHSSEIKQMLIKAGAKTRQELSSAPIR